MRRNAVVTGAVACIALSALFLFAAVDVVRSRNALRADDVRFRTAPAATGLWDPPALMPSRTTQALLGVGDDLAFRRALRAVRLAMRDDPKATDTEKVLQRAAAESRLAAVAQRGGDLVRRSRALALLSVLRLSTPVASPEEREAVVKVAVADLQEAIALDPGNDDAKYDLEFTLRRNRGTQTAQGGPTPNSSGGAGSSKGAATSGPPKSGY
jgi:hypothetical protein